MKILCSSYEFPPIGGGGSNVAFPLARALVARGHSVDVVTSGMSGLPVTEVMDGVTVHRVSCVRKHRHFTTTAELFTYLLPAYRKTAELHKKLQFDVNHTHFALPTGLVSYMLLRRHGVPYITTVHGSDIPGYNPDRFHLAHKIAKPLWTQIIRNSTRIVCASNFLKNLLHTHIEVPVDIIPNGFDSMQFASKHKERKNLILVVSRIFRRKGIQHFVDALDGINHNWDVVVAGDGPYLPALKEQARRIGLDVRFAGYVQGEALSDLYATAKIFVFPSLQENFPVVLLEAMHAGCAVVTTSAQGCGEVIGNAGIATTPEQPDEIRKALQLLIDDEPKIAELGMKAKERVKLFGWSRIADRYESLLRDTILDQSAILQSPATSNDGGSRN